LQIKWDYNKFIIFPVAEATVKIGNARLISDKRVGK
jgi:hypothetical protein